MSARQVNRCSDELNDGAEDQRRRYGVRGRLMEKQDENPELPLYFRADTRYNQLPGR